MSFNLVEGCHLQYVVAPCRILTSRHRAAFVVSGSFGPVPYGYCCARCRRLGWARCPMVTIRVIALSSFPRPGGRPSLLASLACVSNGAGCVLGLGGACPPQCVETGTARDRFEGSSDSAKRKKGGASGSVRRR